MDSTRALRCYWFSLLALTAITVGGILLLPDGDSREDDQAPAPAFPNELEILRAIEKAADEYPRFVGVVSSGLLMVILLGVAIDARFLWRLARRGRRRGGAPFSGTPHTAGPAGCRSSPEPPSPLSVEPPPCPPDNPARETPSALDGAPPTLRISTEVFSLLEGEPPWGLWDVGRVILLFVMAIFALYALSPLLDTALPDASVISVAMVFQFAAEAAALLFLVLLSPDPVPATLRELGLRSPRPLAAIRTGIVAYTGFLPALILLTLATERLAGLAGIPLEPQEQIGFFFADLSRASLAFLVLFVAVIGPVFEEVFFRGFAYRALRGRIGRAAAVAATAVLFSSLHTNLAAFLPIAGLGVLLACVYERTGSLLAPIAVHILQNSFAVAGALFIRSISGGSP